MGLAGWIALRLLIFAAISAGLTRLSFSLFGRLSGPSFWGMAVVLLPVVSMAYAAYLEVSFDPTIPLSTIPQPDPGPLNFVQVVTYGAVLPILYLVAAIPTALLIRRNLRSK